MKPNLQAETIDPWDSFESAAEVIAFVHAKLGGAEALRQCLAGIEGLRRETLEKVAAELTEIGLHKAAAVVRAEAENRPSSIEDCPYPPGGLDAKAWIASWHRRNG